MKQKSWLESHYLHLVMIETYKKHNTYIEFCMLISFTGRFEFCRCVFYHLSNVFPSFIPANHKFITKLFERKLEITCGISGAQKKIINCIQQIWKLYLRTTNSKQTNGISNLIFVETWNILHNLRQVEKEENLKTRIKVPNFTNLLQ